MMMIAIFLALVAQCYASSESRIVNGTDAIEGEIPYIVSIQYQGEHVFGGSILNEKHILTAAHCVYGRSQYRFNIQYGVLDVDDETRNRIMVSSIEYHQSYIHSGGYDNDIAILTLESPIVFSKNVQPIVLPLQDEANLPARTPSVLAGWGYQKSGGNVQPHLQKVMLEMYSDEDCERLLKPRTKRQVHVCSGYPPGGKGQCTGDSGGPLYSNGKQVGIVSWSKKPCARLGLPGVFTRVAKYVDWIKERMNRE